MEKSKSPRKQRRRIHHSKQNRRGKLVSAHLSPKYLEDTKVRYPKSLPLRAGDTVKVMRGSDRGKEGRVTDVDRRGIRVFVEGVTVAKADGTEVGKPIHPSNLMITKLDMTDPWRRRLIDRAGEES